ncbi:MAG TPA: hypothetical protein DCM38_05405 [Gammaproteobacteria bacterium]|nr:hypothetical protein [Gammaproteobacteria bacterium]
MARRKPSRVLRKTIYIVTEGTNTEPNYFKGIIQQIEKSAEYSFDVRLVDTDKTDAVGLVNEATFISIKPEYDEVWAVFDKNGYTQHRQAFDKAEQNNIKIAFSSIAFEIWVLLHFERNKTPFGKAQSVIDYLREKKYLVDYDKRANTYIYPKLKHRTELAIENAVWLRREMKVALAQGKIYELNPYTTVDHLVAKILEMHDKVIWENVDESINLGKISVTVHKTPASNNTLDITISIENHHTVTYALNNYNQRFYLANELICSLPFSFDKTILIEPSTKKDIMLNLPYLENAHLRLDFICDKTKMII